MKKFINKNTSFRENSTEENFKKIIKLAPQNQNVIKNSKNNEFLKKKMILLSKRLSI